MGPYTISASLWGPLRILCLGQPIIADFDGDGKSEIGIRGWYNYLIFDRNGNLKNKFPLPTDYVLNPLIAPAVFDLDGDGFPEIMFEDSGKVQNI